jgi:hypothetical protein
VRRVEGRRGRLPHLPGGGDLRPILFGGADRFF